jgi:hypothetical protein
MRKLAVGVMLAGLLLMPSTTALADGGFFNDIGQDIYQPSQKAVIFFADGREDLILSVRYEGNADEFAWVIPVPARPSVEVADPQLFWELADLTRVHVVSGSRGFAPGMGSLEGTGVDVLEEKIVGPYDVAILSAGDPAALVDWLNSNGYSFPEASEEIIEEYIRKGWFFVASRINIGEEASGLAKGTIEPLILSFESDRIVYPLRITSVSSDFCEVLLYVFTKQAVVPEEYQFLTLNTAEQVAYFERADNVFYIESGDEIPLGELVNRPAIGQVLFYREYGETIEIEDYWEVEEELISQMEDAFSNMNYLTKLRSEVRADKMFDIELKIYRTTDYLDSDGDGWSDAEESLVGSDPQKVDTDGDGMLDTEDPNPLTRDTLPDWLLLVALAASLLIAFVIWLISWKITRR